MSNSTTPASAANERDQQAFEAIADKYEISIEPAYGATKVSGVTLPYKYAHTTHLFNIFMEGIQAARAISQPAAEPVKLDPVVEANRAMLHSRSQFGIRKYGVTLDDAQLSERALLTHALEEALDLANYLQANLQRVDAVLAKTGTSTDSAADGCNWVLADEDGGVWESSCGEAWTFIGGGPKENNVRFCQGCGKPAIAAMQLKGDAA